jgi:hypothetical protein
MDVETRQRNARRVFYINTASRSYLPISRHISLESIIQIRFYLRPF